MNIRYRVNRKQADPFKLLVLLTSLLLLFVSNLRLYGQTYSTMQYEVVQNASANIVINQDMSNICDVKRYGFQSYDEAYIPELNGPSDIDFGTNVKFFHNTAGIYAINVWQRKATYPYFDFCLPVDSRTNKFIYVFVKPQSYLNTITLPINGPSYSIQGVFNNSNQRRQGDCSNEIEFGWKSAFFQYTNELSSPAAKYSLPNITINPTSVGSFTFIPVSRYADRPGLPCTSNTQYTDFKDWQAVTVKVENFTWKNTTPTIVCRDQGVIDLASNFNITSGVSFEGPGVSGNSFNPTSAGVGTHQIRAKKTYSSGLEYEDIFIEVISSTTLTSTLPTKTCNDLDLTLFFSANKTGGSWAFTALTTSDAPTGGVTGNSLVLSQTTVAQVKIVASYSINGCSISALSRVIDVVPGGNGSLTITNSSSYCQGSSSIPLTYSVTGASAASATWSGAGVTGSTLNMSGLPAGTEANIKVQVTTTSGCILNSSKNITVKPSPNLNFSILEENHCNTGQTINLNNSYQPKDGNNSISGTWSSSNGSVNTKISSGSISLTGLAQGTYPLTFSYTNPSGCTVTQTLSNSLRVYEQPKATLQLNVSPQDAVCQSTNFTLSTEAVSANLGINWFSPSGYSGSATSITTGTLSTGEYQYNLFVNNNSNPACISNANVILSVSNPTPLAFANNIVSVCQGEYQIDLNSKAIPNYTSGYFSCSNPVINDRLSGTWRETLNLGAIPTGNYVVTYSVPVNTCLLTKTFTLNITSAYGDPAVIGNTILCNPQSVNYNIASPVAGLTYQWYDSQNAATPFLQSISFQTPILSENTTYYIQGYNASTKCASNRTPLNIVVQRMDLIAVNAGTDLASCTNIVTFNLDRAEVQPAGGGWSGPGVSGTTFNGSSLLNNKAYPIIYSYTQGLCTKRDTLLVTLGIDIKPTVSKKTVQKGELVTFDHNYPNATSTYWNFGDGIKSIDRQASHYYYKEGYKNVTLTITVEQNGTCSGTFTMPDFINVIDDGDVITGTEDPILREGQIQAFPNPFKESLSIKSLSQIGLVRIALIAMDGRIVFENTHSLQEGNQELISKSDLVSISPGVYILKVTGAGSGNTLSMRLLKL